MGSSKKTPDATRAERKAKKRKLEATIPDLPGDDEGREENDAEVEKPLKKRKRGEDGKQADEDLIEEKDKRATKKEKKRRRKEGDAAVEEEGEKVEKKAKRKVRKAELAAQSAEIEEQVLAPPTVGDATEEIEGEKALRKSKKERKAERKAREAEMAAQSAATEKQVTALPTNGDAASAETEEKKAKNNNRNREKKRKAGAGEQGSGEDKTTEKPARFIVFIGNLPFTTTTASLQKHFAAVKPKSIRHLTHKDNPAKSKGIAFVEFEGYDHMKTCLKLFHHSMFDDGLSPPRKINVELTAGGGGNTNDRKAKIEVKNRKLNEQRIRRIEEEEKAKFTKREAAAAIDESAIHPSRRGFVPGA